MTKLSQPPSVCVLVGMVNEVGAPMMTTPLTPLVDACRLPKILPNCADMLADTPRTQLPANIHHAAAHYQYPR